MPSVTMFLCRAWPQMGSRLLRRWPISFMPYGCNPVTLYRLYKTDFTLLGLHNFAFACFDPVVKKLNFHCTWRSIVKPSLI